MNDTSSNPPLDRVEVFYGEANPVEARIYARLPRGDDMDLSLQGHVSGPVCEYARTLPARMALIDQGSGTEILAQAVVPDPCFWTPQLPMLYRVGLELRRGAEVLSSTERWLGLRRLGVRGNWLILDGRPWVPRIVAAAAVDAEPLASWRELNAAMYADNPGDDLCLQAGRWGVPVVAEVAGSGEDVLRELRRLSAHVAVGAVVVASSQLPSRHDLVGAARNLLLVQRWDPGSSREPAAWADAMLCAEAELASPPPSLPIIVQRKMPESATLAAAREACDTLQGDLAARGQFAGYLIAK